jgi:hypothetical protein
MHTNDFNDRTDGSPGNNSRTLLCGLQENMLGAEQSMHLVRNRSRRKGDMHQVFLGLLNRLCDRNGHFRSLPFPDADPPLSISNNNQCAKVEPLSTLDDFRNAVDKDDFVLQA